MRVTADMLHVNTKKILLSDIYQIFIISDRKRADQGPTVELSSLLFLPFIMDWVDIKQQNFTRSSELQHQAVQLLHFCSFCFTKL